MVMDGFAIRAEANNNPLAPLVPIVCEPPVRGAIFDRKPKLNEHRRKGAIRRESARAVARSKFPALPLRRGCKCWRRAVRSHNGFSISHALLVAPRAKLGRREEAKAVARRVMVLQPSFSAEARTRACPPPACAAPSSLRRRAWPETAPPSHFLRHWLCR